MRRLLPSLALPLALLACTPRVVIPDSERDRVASELEGRKRFLRVAAYVAPLWGDRSKRLLCDQPLAELDLVETPEGTPIAPPAAERVLPPGTPVRIDRIEFPTAWTIAGRVVMSPRYHPWAMVQVGGDERSYVVVLSQTVASLEDVRNDLDRLLSTDDPSGAFAALPQEQRDAILDKKPSEGMSPRALEMAWGVPEKRRIDRPAGSEEWSWPGGKRRAFFQEDKLVRWEPKTPP
ncbi:MAG TPA: hypothetical protein VLU43_08710 [Anaeromyxobacteraceae bacterium]|nr:hypothetical protein [Anaeromyxobacteraceae bacterium]